MNSLNRLVPAITACVCMAIPSVSTAETGKPIEGYVVRIANSEVVVDLGSSRGLPPNARLQVYRKVVVEHPVTGKKITDRFPIGAMTLTQVGDKLSISRDWRGLSQPPSLGDYVRFEADAAPSSGPAEPTDTIQIPPNEPARGHGTPGRQALEQAFQDTLGRSLYDRIAIWDAWLKEFPDSQFAEEVGNEVHWLRVMIEKQTAPSETPPPVTKEPTVSPVVTAPQLIIESTPLQIEFTTDEPGLVDTVRLHTRRRGAPTYTTSELSRGGDFNWRGAIPEELTNGPGELEYFIDTVRTDGQLETDEQIRRAAVLPDPQAPDRKEKRSQATMVYEFVDFRVGPGADEFHRFEADFRYDVGTILDGFSVGAGMLRGTGASLAELEAGEPSRTLNLSYAFAEVDFEFIEYIGVGGRFLIGNRQQLSLQDSILQDAFGGNLEFRFGPRLGTHLLVGGAVTDAIGSEAWIELFIDAIDKTPMSGEVVVTNMPVGENLGVSLNYGVGREITDWFTVMARVGWNARTIFDYGFAGGLSTQFQW